MSLIRPPALTGNPASDVAALSDFVWSLQQSVQADRAKRLTAQALADLPPEASMSDLAARLNAIKAALA